MSQKLNNILLIILLVNLAAVFECSSISGKEPENTVSEEQAEGTVKFSRGLISVQAKDMRPEDLMKEVGEKCGLKIVLYGEVFTDAPVSVQFQQMPVRTGIQRILRMAKINNYLMHFGEGQQEQERIVQLDLIGKKGGQRELTSGANKNLKKLVAEQMKTLEESPAIRKDSGQREPPKIAPPQINKQDAERLQQNFLNMMDQLLEQKFEKGEEPDPTAILQLFNDMVPPDMRDKIPPEVLEQLEKLKE